MVPIVSNISMNRKVNTTTSISQLRILWNSNWQKIGETLCGRDTSCRAPASLCANCVTAAPVAGSLITRPISVVMMIPMRMPPRTFSITRPAVIIKPIIATRAVPWVIFPRVTSVESEFTMIPAFCRPMKAMNRPIPAPMAFFKVPGMALMSQVRTLVTVRMMNRSPSRSTAVRANCQL